MSTNFILNFKNHFLTLKSVFVHTLQLIVFHAALSFLKGFHSLTSFAKHESTCPKEIEFLIYINLQHWQFFFLSLISKAFQIVLWNLK